MDHLLFDALKISPIPMETANKATATGWMLEIEKLINQIIENSNNNYDIIDKKIEELFQTLKAELEKEIDSDTLLNKYYEKIKVMIMCHINDLIGEGINYIRFGLSDDGYLYIDIPENLKEISFDTNTNPENEDYGKLQILY